MFHKMSEYQVITFIDFVYKETQPTHNYDYISTEHGHSIHVVGIYRVDILIPKAPFHQPCLLNTCPLNVIFYINSTDVGVLYDYILQ